MDDDLAEDQSEWTDPATGILYQAFKSSDCIGCDLDIDRNDGACGRCLIPCAADARRDGTDISWREVTQ